MLAVVLYVDFVCYMGYCMMYGLLYSMWSFECCVGSAIVLGLLYVMWPVVGYVDC